MGRNVAVGCHRKGWHHTATLAEFAQKWLQDVLVSTNDQPDRRIAPMARSGDF